MKSLEDIRVGTRVLCAHCGEESTWAWCRKCEVKFLDTPSAECTDADNKHARHQVLYHQPSDFLGLRVPDEGHYECQTE